VTTLTGRTDFWPLAIDLIGKRPFVGWGVDAIESPAGEKFQEVARSWVSDEPPAPRTGPVSHEPPPEPPGVGQAHNAFLEAGIQSGVIGLVAWAGSLFAAIVGICRLPRTSKYRFPLIIGSVLVLVFAFTESSPAWFGDMFIVYVLCLALYAEALQPVARRARALERVRRAVQLDLA
jgi:O-antigen ligase